MVALDTNIIVRLITQDDPAQVERARSLILQRSGLVQTTVLLETEWVLRYSYGFDKDQIALAFRLLGQTQAVELACSNRLDVILAAYCDGMDFGDALHLAHCPVASFASFDRALAAKALRFFPDIAVIAP